MSATGVRTAPAPYDATSTASPGISTGRRIDSVDMLRGIVVVLMAIDHVRVYSGIPAGGTTAGIFFTRWITHFCAPVFVFLAGTGAFLQLTRTGDRPALSRYLLSRGLLLVALELTVIRFFWTFNFAYSQFTLAGVIWMLGWSMVLMAGLVRFSPRTVGIIGVATMVLQQLFGLAGRALPPSIGSFWQFIYPAGFDGPPGISILYVIVPWVGVMAAGYGFGSILLRPEAERRKLCLRIGLTATVAFLVLGVLAASQGGDGAPFLFRLLNQGKYPPTQLYLLMTLGPAIAAIPFLERARGWLAGALTTFGRVPMFYYLLHIPLIHVSALAVNMLRDGAMHSEWYASAPFASVPKESRWPLGLLYLVFLIDVVILYAACRWFAAFKARRRDRWLSYI